MEIVKIGTNREPYYTNKSFISLTKIVFSKKGDNSSQAVMLGMKPEAYSHPPLVDVLFSLVPDFMSTLFSFIIRWFGYTIIILLVLKLLRENVESKTILLALTGYTLAPTIVYGLLKVLIAASLPTAYLPLQAWKRPFASLELQHEIYQDMWYSTFMYQLGVYSIYVVDIWIIALCSVAIYALGVDWKKAISSSVVSYLINFGLRYFVLGFLSNSVA